MVVQQASTDLQRQLLRIALPERYALWLGNAVEAANALLANDVGGRVLVLVPDVDELVRLKQAGLWLPELVLGSQGWRKGRQRLSRQVYLSPSEMEVLQSIAASGTRIIIQTHYHDPPHPFGGASRPA
jgi:mannose/fructose/N-acetylgalactosamine-specific phosphotransferase system component IIB